MEINKTEKWVFTILIYFIIVLTLLNVSTFITAQVQIRASSNLKAQMKEQQTSLNSFVGQIQRCKTMGDIDRVLGANGIQRVE